MDRGAKQVPVRNIQSLVGLACLLTLAAPVTASAITADVARACDAAVAKAFPPKQVGNPAAGSAKGSGQAQRDYFSKCVAKDGNMDDGADKNAK
jgi:hypothetical protein